MGFWKIGLNTCQERKQERDASVRMGVSVHRTVREHETYYMGARIGK